MAAAAVLSAVTVGVPWVLLALAGSPIPDRLPTWDEFTAALSRPDDGTLLLGFLTYVAWGLWLVWVLLLLLEIGAQLRGRSAPRIPGLSGPQQLAALLVTSLGAAIIGTAASVGRATAVPGPPQTVAASTAYPRTVPSSQPVDAVEDQGSATELARFVQPKQHQSVVRFEFDSAQLSAAANDVLTQTADDIQRHADPATPVRIVGHTDSTGPAAYNKQLSVRRAQAVRQALGQLAAHGFRFEVSGKGESAPIAANDDASGRARNRRVEITYARKVQAGPTGTPTSSPPRQTRPDGSRPPESAPLPTPMRSSPLGSTPPPDPSPTPSATDTSAASKVPQPPSHDPSTSKDHPVTVALPSGAMVGLSFAAGVGTALAVSRLHRRRRHRTPRTGPDLTSGEPEPPPTVRRLRRADLAARDDEHPDPEHPSDHGGRLHLFPMASSGRITLGVRDGDEVTVPIGGLIAGFTGPGADAAARALLLSLLMHAGDHDVEILIPQRDARRLLMLDADGLAATAEYVRALEAAPDLGAALRRLESERIHRARLLDTTDGHSDLAAIRDADPAEPLPRLVLIATPDDEHRRRLEAICASADLYDVAIVLLGEHPAGPTLHLDESGHTQAIRGGEGADDWHGLQFFHLAPDDVGEVLEVIRGAHGAPEPEPISPTVGTQPVPPVPPSPVPPAAIQERPVQLRVLGPPTLTVDENELATGIRGSARELLTYLAIHPDGASRDTILETLLPDIDQRRAIMRFHAAINDVRRELRRATGLAHESFIIVTADRYRIDPELITVDLWTFQTALHQLSQASDDRQRASLLEQAGDIYAGNLAAEQSYEWIEPEREALRRQAVEALTHLADLNEHNNEPERALAALEHAKTIDRYAEEIYQRIMILQSRLGRPDAIRRTHRLLQTNLEDLGVDPTEETQQLLWRLLNPHRRPEATTTVLGSENE